MAEVYHLWQNETVQGPFTLGQVRAMWNGGKLTAQDLFSRSAGQEWHYLGDILTDLEPVTASNTIPVAIPTIIQQKTSEQSPSNKGVIIALVIFFLVVVGVGLFLATSHKTLQGSYGHTFVVNTDEGNITLDTLYDFNSDGTVTDTVAASAVSPNGETIPSKTNHYKGTYVITGNDVTITWSAPDTDPPETLHISGDVLTRHGDDIRFDRK